MGMADFAQDLKLQAKMKGKIVFSTCRKDNKFTALCHDCPLPPVGIAWFGDSL